MTQTTADVTQLLKRYHGGDRTAEAELFDVLYRELRRLAAYYMRGERAGHTLQPTALVNEAYMRLVQPGHGPWADRTHFVSAAAQAMRRVLVDCARRSKARKRNAGIDADMLPDNLAAPQQDPVLVIALDSALESLAKLDERKARVVELRYFAGMSLEDVAAVTGLSVGTVKREWTFARAWLRGEVSHAALSPR